MLLLFPVLAGCSGPTADTGVVVASPDDTAPQTVETIAAEGWPALVINEFMASNQGTVTDGTGSYSDWLELYNPTDQTVSLGGWSLTDDLDDPEMSVLDDALSIGPGGYLLLWADGDLSEGPDHLDFRLSQEGGQLGLFAPDERAMDRMNYAAQAADLSAARIPDGSATWALSDNPTPGEGNAQ